MIRHALLWLLISLALAAEDRPSTPNRNEPMSRRKRSTPTKEPGSLQEDVMNELLAKDTGGPKKAKSDALPRKPTSLNAQLGPQSERAVRFGGQEDLGPSRQSDPLAAQQEIAMLKRQLYDAEMRAQLNQSGSLPLPSARMMPPFPGGSSFPGGSMPQMSSGPSFPGSMPQLPASSSSPFQQLPSSSRQGIITSKDLLNMPGVKEVREDIQYDEFNNKIVVATIITETPRGLKTSRVCFHPSQGNTSVPPPSSNRLKASDAGMMPKSTARVPNSSGSQQGQSSGLRRTNPTPRSGPAITGQYKMDNGYVLQTTVEMPFPHVAQAKILALSKAGSADVGTGGGALTVDIGEGSGREYSDDVPENDGAFPDPDSPKKSGKGPITLRRMAEAEGKRKEANNQGSNKGFMTRVKASKEPSGVDPTDTVINIEDDGPDIRKRKKASDPPYDPSFVPNAISAGNLKQTDAGGKGPKATGRRLRMTDSSAAADQDGTGTNTDKGQSTGQNDDGADPSDPHNDTVILDEHEESDSFEDDHPCKRIQVVLRVAEHAVVVGLGSSIANVAAILLSVISKLGGFG